MLCWTVAISIFTCLSWGGGVGVAVGAGVGVGLSSACTEVSCPAPEKAHTAIPVPRPAVRVTASKPLTSNLYKGTRFIRLTEKYREKSLFVFRFMKILPRSCFT